MPILLLALMISPTVHAAESTARCADVGLPQIGEIESVVDQGYDLSPERAYRLAMLHRRSRNPSTGEEESFSSPVDEGAQICLGDVLETWYGSFTRVLLLDPANTAIQGEVGIEGGAILRFDERLSQARGTVTYYTIDREEAWAGAPVLIERAGLALVQPRSTVRVEIANPETGLAYVSVLGGEGASHSVDIIDAEARLGDGTRIQGGQTKRVTPAGWILDADASRADAIDAEMAAFQREAADVLEKPYLSMDIHHDCLLAVVAADRPQGVRIDGERRKLRWDQDPTGEWVARQPTDLTTGRHWLSLDLPDGRRGLFVFAVDEAQEAPVLIDARTLDPEIPTPAGILDRSGWETGGPEAVGLRPTPSAGMVWLAGGVQVVQYPEFSTAFAPRFEIGGMPVSRLRLSAIGSIEPYMSSVPPIGDSDRKMHFSGIEAGLGAHVFPLRTRWPGIGLVGTEVFRQSQGATGWVPRVSAELRLPTPLLGVLVGEVAGGFRWELQPLTIEDKESDLGQQYENWSVYAGLVVSPAWRRLR